MTPEDIWENYRSCENFCFKRNIMKKYKLWQYPIIIGVATKFVCRSVCETDFENSAALFCIITAYIDLHLSNIIIKHVKLLGNNSSGATQSARTLFEIIYLFISLFYLFYSITAAFYFYKFFTNHFWSHHLHWRHSRPVNITGLSGYVRDFIFQRLLTVKHTRLLFVKTSVEINQYVIEYTWLSMHEVIHHNNHHGVSFSFSYFYEDQTIIYLSEYFVETKEFCKWY